MHGDGESSLVPFGTATETHSAVVYFAGDRAYKLKKPVNLGFLDFSTRQARAAACARETELNRRFSPDAYLGVAEVRDPDGRPCDHLVVMRRMPARRQLSALVRAGEHVDEPVREVARILARQHASSPRSIRIDQEGSRGALSQRWHDNVEQARHVAAEIVGGPVIDEVARLAERFLAGREPLFEARVGDGRVVDGHGDLLADDIYCLEDGPRILDCLDFDDRLRWVDGLDDAAFLAMDLERLGAPGLARLFVEWYAEYSGDPAPASLRHHYVAYRAFVRAKVCAIKSGQGDLGAGGLARQLAELTLRHLRAGTVTMVLVGGLPGTGKTTVAGAVADRLGWAVLSSDQIRKELAGLSPRDSAASAYGTGIYTPEWSERCYSELLHRARMLLAQGESVVADASWIAASHRAAAAATAGDVSAQLVQLCCAAPADLARQRMTSRHGSASDADGAIARQMAAVMDAWPEATTIDTAYGTPQADDVAGLLEALDVIRPHGADQVWRGARPVILPG
ncbi:MAG TPA: AAA family ATPase [Streptosporangiaceae bacterium]|nr:AAA family ATPase [Streptosporangiaceae bacterium]